MIGEHRVLNELLTPAVVVNQHHVPDVFQHILKFHHAGPVSIHHHKQGPLINEVQGPVLAYDPLLVDLPLQKAVKDHVCIVMAAVNGDIHVRLSVMQGPEQSHRRPEAVRVPVPVSHDEYIRGMVRQIPQGMGHNACLDLCALLNLPALGAVELESLDSLDHRLVSAPSQRHIQRRPGQLFILPQRGAGFADANADCDRKPVALFDLFDLAQHAELLLQQRLKERRLKEHNELVPLISGDDALAPLHPLVDAPLNIPDQGAVAGIGRTLEHLVIVVNHHRTDNDLFRLQPLLQLMEAGQIRKIQAHHGINNLILIGPHSPAGNPVISVPVGVFLRRGVLILHKPAELKL